ncbi:uncharacterized protein SCHCODRAFT_02167926 [Schizophyllum commune H4-8]|uniref:uncharacterized protein n=1 Tax=Schizophyllum commune (strain H4-8 / FGSC 9210) TaxID=578458 RepID=UPI002160C05B|nr:uncharacterized protein SCHCODRAFT_02167926 [Schizophyllum commune H4-8]KAI5898559.1 hypothetical protein SCHCODRAFT_02167926 [Schizophyllum commune H4-8]
MMKRGIPHTKTMASSSLLSCLAGETDVLVNHVHLPIAFFRLLLLTRRRALLSPYFPCRMLCILLCYVYIPGR